MTTTATYSPDDNKIRLYPSARLDPETYAKVRAAGFIWAPKQGLFVAPAWTPEREDLARELAGEIDDEDKTLIERADERAERFDEYSEHRERDAQSAQRAVSAIADNISLGQPILVGHHSEKRARRDAEKIENGMRRAVKMWETSKYWTDRAQGAIAHAKYKERPDVRARRIKTLEAERRKVDRSATACAQLLRLWKDPTALKNKATGQHATMREGALHIANQERGCALRWSRLDREEITPEQAAAEAIPEYERTAARCARWLAHLDNRLAYERAMLADAGGTQAERVKPEKGGACQCWASPRNGWSYIQKVNQVSVTVLDNWGNGGANFTRTIPFDKLARLMSAADVQAARDTGQLVHIDERGFLLRNAPLPDPKPTAPEPVDAQPFEQMKEALRQGVKVIAAPQLFPTPPDLAARMVDLAQVPIGAHVLEPSAGTGNLIAALPGRLPFDGGAQTWCKVTAVEINLELANALATRCKGTVVKPGDFLDKTLFELGRFERILMNPPFADGADIKHIRHALTFLQPGGRLVALCANGPRQQEHIRPIAGEWIELEPGTFKEQGTAVNVALLVIDAPAQASAEKAQPRGQHALDLN
jgi:protein-L-isoaspartate O-methyltransferase